MDINRISFIYDGGAVSLLGQIFGKAELPKKKNERITRNRNSTLAQVLIHYEIVDRECTTFVRVDYKTNTFMGKILFPQLSKCLISLTLHHKKDHFESLSYGYTVNIAG